MLQPRSLQAFNRACNLDETGGDQGWRCSPPRVQSFLSIRVRSWGIFFIPVASKFIYFVFPLAH